MVVDVVLGLQWGDEGKGKIVDALCEHYDWIARFQGGANAGHTIYVNHQKVVLHQIPSGILRPEKRVFLGAGMVIDPIQLKAELSSLQSFLPSPHSRIYIAKEAHVTLPTHLWIEKALESRSNAIGTTLKGIGPTYGDKYYRQGVRLVDLLHPHATHLVHSLVQRHLRFLSHWDMEPDARQLEKELQTFWESIEVLKDCNLLFTYEWLQLAAGALVLAEGAQGTLLDIHYGTYPYVTSSHTISGGCTIGLGIPPRAIRHIIGVAKAYVTRVGEGPFPSRMPSEVEKIIRKHGNEFGATTGRPRQCGWLDLPALSYAITLNGVTHLILTKLDVLTALPHFQIVTHYEPETFPPDTYFYDKTTPVTIQFPSWTKCDFNDANFHAFLSFLQDRLPVPITHVSIGPEREHLIPLSPTPFPS